MRNKQILSTSIHSSSLYSLMNYRLDRILNLDSALDVDPLLKWLISFRLQWEQYRRFLFFSFTESIDKCSTFGQLDRCCSLTRCLLKTLEKTISAFFIPIRWLILLHFLPLSVWDEWLKDRTKDTFRHPDDRHSTKTKIDPVIFLFRLLWWIKVVEVLQMITPIVLS